MIDLGKISAINNLLKDEEKQKQVINQINATFGQNKKRLSEISDDFRFENEDELEIFCNSVLDIVNQRIEKIHNELDLFNITKNGE